MGWTCLEELVWGDKEHKWVKPGVLHTRGPGDLGPANSCSLVCSMLSVADAQASPSAVPSWRCSKGSAGHTSRIMPVAPVMQLGV